MSHCGNCGENVRPNIYFRWSDFIRGLGIFYLIYIISKIPQCPNCNFPLPRRTMVLAIQPQNYFAKLSGMSVLHLIHLTERITSAPRRSYLNHKPDLFKYSSGMKIPQTTSLNVMVNEVHESISSKTMSLKSNISSGDLYDKETTKIFDQLGSHLLARQKDEHS
jgi:hypothetical protein